MFTPYDYQIQIAKKAFAILKENGLAYLAMEERTGKSLTALLVCEQSNVLKEVLIVTKKKALPGWQNTLDNYEIKKSYTLINYESLHKLEGKKFDFVIIDESHYALGSYPKQSKTFKMLIDYTWGVPLLYLSATPNAESYSQLYHQFALSKWSPFKEFRNFYDWHRTYGIPHTEHISGRLIQKYNYTKEEEIKNATRHLFISFTRAELGFAVEPKDCITFVQPTSRTLHLMKTLKKDSILHEYEYVCESPAKEMVGLHQIEGGTLKLENESIFLGNTEKIDYIKQTYGDTNDLVIMYNYVAEGDLLKAHFKNALILQGTAFAEGVDLSTYKHLVIYSMNFSASKFIQRRARQCNKNRTEPIEVDFVLMKGCVSEMAYKAIVKDKLSFTQSYYLKNRLSFKDV